MEELPSGFRFSLLLPYFFVFGVACALWTILVSDAIPFNRDTVRDLLAAKECALGMTCERIAPSSSGFFHGFIWVRFLSLFYLLGVEVTYLPAVVQVLYALSYLLAFHVLRATQGHKVAMITTILYIVLTVKPVFLRSGCYWNPTLLVPVTNLFLFTVYLFLREPRRRAGGLVAVALSYSLGTQVHLSYLFLLPAVIELVCRYRRKWLGLALFVGVSVSFWYVLSTESLLSNVDQLLQIDELRGPVDASGGAPPLRQSLPVFAIAGLVAVAVLLLGRVLERRRGHRVARELDRLIRISIVSSLSVLGAISLARNLQGHHFLVVFPLMVLWLVGAVIAWSAGIRGARVRTTVRLALVAAAAVVAVVGPLTGALGPGRAASSPRSNVTLQQVDDIVRHAQSRGYGVEELYASLSAGQSLYFQMISSLWLHAPCLSDRRTLGTVEGPLPRLFVVKLPTPVSRFLASEIPDAEVLESGGESFLTLKYLPYLHHGRVGVCRYDAPEEAHECVESPFQLVNSTYGRQCYGTDIPFDAELMFHLAASDGRYVEVVMNVSVPAGSPTRLLYLPHVQFDGAEPRCSGVFVGAQGIRWRVDPMRRTLEVRGTTRAQEGRVRLRWDLHQCLESRLEFRFPQPIVELDPAVFYHIRRFLD